MEDDFITISKEKYANLQGQIMALEIENMTSLDTQVQKVLEWARQRNIHKGSTYKDQYLKAQSEMGELADALLKGTKDDTEDAIGDVIVCLINLAEQCDTNLNICLDKAYQSIKDRKGIMFNGAFVKETDTNYERIVRHVASESDHLDLFSK